MIQVSLDKDLQLLASHKLKQINLLGDAILKICVCVLQMRYVTRQAHNHLLSLANIPQNVRDGGPQGRLLIHLGRLQHLIQWNRLFLGTIIKQKVFDNEGLDDGLEATGGVAGASKPVGQFLETWSLDF